MNNTHNICEILIQTNLKVKTVTTKYITANLPHKGISSNLDIPSTELLKHKVTTALLTLFI